MDVDDINWLVKSCCEAEDILVLPVFKSTFHTFTLCKQKPILPKRRPLLVAINKGTFRPGSIIHMLKNVFLLDNPEDKTLQLVL